MQKKSPHYEERRTERINKGHRERRHQRRATESLRKIRTAARNIEDVDEYLDEFDDLYDDD